MDACQQQSTLRWLDDTDQKPNTRRRQIITLQAYIVSFLDEGFNYSLPLNWSKIVWPTDKPDIGIDTRRGGERIYVSSRQSPVRDEEDRLLAEIRDSPIYASSIRGRSLLMVRTYG